MDIKDDFKKTYDRLNCNFIWLLLNWIQSWGALDSPLYKWPLTAISLKALSYLEVLVKITLYLFIYLLYGLKD